MGKSFEEIGLDRSLPHIGVIMEKYDPEVYPGFPLPEGFAFSGYRPGREESWAQLQREVGQTDSLEEARQIFAEEFLPSPGLSQRMVFVLDGAGDLAATGAVWPGTIFGEERQRLHWVAVAPKYQGRGISKALVTRLLDLAQELGCRDYLYLTSQTWSYKALNVYGGFGFQPYLGEKPKNWRSVDLASGRFEPWDYATKNREAWDMIHRKIAEYRQKG